jgi:hypothetical protein
MEYTFRAERRPVGKGRTLGGNFIKSQPAPAKQGFLCTALVVPGRPAFAVSLQKLHNIGLPPRFF